MADDGILRKTEVKEYHGKLSDALKQTIEDVAKTTPELTTEEVLAIVSQIAGSLVAMLDNRIFTSEMALEIISRNVEEGNRLIVNLSRPTLN